jgi:hypothetical protein
MANLLGDLFYPDNPARRAEINQLHEDALSIQNTVVSLINDFNAAAKLANELASYNALFRALAETWKSPYKEEELRKPLDLTDKPYEEAMVSSILDLAARTVGGTAVNTLLGGALKAYLNRPIASVARNVSIELMSLGAARNLVGAPGLAPAAVEGIAAGAEPAVANVARIATRAEKFAKGLRLVKVSGAAVVLTVGVEVVLGVIEGSRERDVLEENLKKLRKQKAALEKDRDGLTDAKADADTLIRQSLEQFNKLQRELAEITPNQPVTYVYNSRSDAENALAEQRKWYVDASSYVASAKIFHKRWGELFARGQEPTPEARNEVFADLITYGLLPNKEAGERRYQTMRKVEAAFDRSAS